MSTTTITNDTKTLIFVYGTLKRNFPNHHHLKTLITSNDVTFVGNHKTIKPYPLVNGPLGIPFLLNKPGSGCLVKGELYSVSSRALARLDVLEGVEWGHYNRLPIAVEYEKEDGEYTKVEAYFAGWNYEDEMWEKSGRKGVEEFLKSDGDNFVGVEGEDVGFGMKDYMLLWLQPFNNNKALIDREGEGLMVKT